MRFDLPTFPAARAGYLLPITILLASCGGGSGNAPATPPAAVAAPVIASQPAPVSVAVGAAANFSVTATGTQLTYQWRRNGADIAGANSASYTLPAAALSDTRSLLSVAVSNPGGSVVSTGAALTVSGIAVLAGSITDTGLVDGGAAAARFNAPAGLAADNLGDIFVSDFANNRVRKISADGTVSTYAGGGSLAYPAVSTGATVLLGQPRAVALDGSQNLYIAEDNRITRITPQGAVTYPVVAPVTPGDSRANVAFSLGAVAVDGGGNIYASNNLGTRKVTPAGATALLEGVDTASLSGTQIYFVKGMALDSAGNLYLRTPDATVHKFGAGGQSALLAGSANNPGVVDGSGAAAKVTQAGQMASDAAGNLYLVDDNVVRKITPAGVVTTVVGQHVAGATQLGALPGLLPTISGIAVDANGALYVSAGNAILKIQLP